MAGHPYLTQVKDPAALAALRQAYDEIAELRRQVTTLQAAALQNSGAMSANGQRITNLGSPTAPTDAVTVQYLRAFVAAQTERV